MPPTRQASKLEDHMMFIPHQDPFIDVLLTAATVIYALLKKVEKVLYISIQ